jgi:hypothetical protein
MVWDLWFVVYSFVKKEKSFIIYCYHIYETVSN